MKKVTLWALCFVVFVVVFSTLFSNKRPFYKFDSVPQNKGSVVVFYDASNSAISFAADELIQALSEKGFNTKQAPLDSIGEIKSEYQFVIASKNAPQVNGLLNISALDSNAESYIVDLKFSRESTQIFIVGNSKSGTMYGGLDIAEIIKINTDLSHIQAVNKSPHINVRGIKFNATLDARTPGYSAFSESAQLNIAEIWDIKFWREYFDEMAKQRFNTLTLWNLHPFPSMVKVPGYESVGLDDVQRPVTLYDGRGKWHRSIPMYEPTMPVETILEMSIDEKITFWKEVMALAKNRGVDFYIFTWNIFHHGTQGSGFDFSDHNSALTKDYFKKSVTALFDTYPDLTGIGVTAGENMRAMDSVQREDWLWETYGEGTKAAMEKYPERKIKFVHRAHFANVPMIMERFKDLPRIDDPESPFEFSFKYSQAHMHSTAKPLRISDFLENLPEGKKTWLTVRQDDAYFMRLGDPVFAREYINNMPEQSQLAGFYIGPDGFTWGRDFLNRNQQAHRPLVIEKFWYDLGAYSRLAYDPELPNEFFVKKLAYRFPEVNSTKLFEAWHLSSSIIPVINRFYWGPLDHFWIPEACRRTKIDKSGRWKPGVFHTVEDFITPVWPPMGGDEDGAHQLMMSVTEYVDGTDDGRLTPLEVANQLFTFGEDAIQLIDGMGTYSDFELQSTVNDIQAMSYLGQYYAHKIRGAVDLQQYRISQNSMYQQQAIAHLQKAFDSWTQYANNLSARYKSQMLTKVGFPKVDMQAIRHYVAKDIELAGGEIPALEPTLTFAAPYEEIAFSSAKQLKVVLFATDNDGIDNIKLYLNGTLVNEMTPVHYTHNFDEPTRPQGIPLDISSERFSDLGSFGEVYWESSHADLQNLAKGDYSLEAVATDNTGEIGKTYMQFTISENRLN